MTMCGQVPEPRVPAWITWVILGVVVLAVVAAERGWMFGYFP